MSKKKHAPCDAVDVGRLRADLESPDEAVRAGAVRSLCPCRAGWELFERHVREVLRLEKDRSRFVRANALHVFRDAAKMQTDGELIYRIQFAEEKLRKKCASRFRPEEAESEAKRKGKSRRRGRSGVVLR